MGALPTGPRLERIQSSKQWGGAQFKNHLPNRPSPPFLKLMGNIFEEPGYSRPERRLRIQKRRKSDFETPPESGLRVTWLGHSTSIVEIDGARVLIDPIWGERASPFSFVGPKRLNEAPLAFEELPDIDVVIISHANYDHLD